MRKYDVNFFRPSENGFCFVVKPVKTVWKIVAVANFEFNDGDIKLAVYGFGDTEEDAKTDLEKKIFIYENLFEGDYL